MICMIATDLAAFVAKSNCVEQNNLRQYLYFCTGKTSTFVLVSVACHDFAAVDDQFEALQAVWLDLRVRQDGIE